MPERRPRVRWGQTWPGRHRGILRCQPIVLRDKLGNPCLLNLGFRERKTALDFVQDRHAKAAASTRFSRGFLRACDHLA